LDRKRRSHALKDTFGFPAFGPHFEPPRVDRQGIHSPIIRSSRISVAAYIASDTRLTGSLEM
jgi:hypothetical protein